MARRYFEFSEGSSNKFWEVWVDANTVFTRYGKIGAGGQTTLKDEGSPAGAQKLHDKLVKEKTGKGYVEKSSSEAAPPAPAPVVAAPAAAPSATPKAAAAPKAPLAPVVVEPGFRRFHFSEGSSNKFWEVKVEGEQQLVRYGKLGTAGQEKEKDFDTAAEAKADTKKLIAEKVGKGYVEVGGAPKLPSNPELEAAIVASPDDKKTWGVFADWLLEQGVPWGEVIAAGVQGKADQAKQKATEKELLGDLEGDIVWANGVISSFDFEPDDTDAAGDGKMEETLAKVLAHPAGHFIRSLTLGLPPSEDPEGWHMDGLIEAVAEAGPLPFLETLDLSPDAEHMDQPSWRRVGDLSDLWRSAPHLKTLLLQGSAGSDSGTRIDFGEIDAPHLEKLVFRSGGLDKKAPLGIGAASLPKLTHLELLFGREDYGCNSTVASLKGILEGSGLPALTTLGLKNSEWKAELIEAVAKSKVLPRLKMLDLGMGVMGTESAEALVANAAKFKHLQQVLLEDNYFSESDQALVKKSLPNAEFGEQKEDEDDPEYRYTTVGE
jgi:uncharacterized protein (TIGR02996 family)